MHAWQVTDHAVERDDGDVNHVGENVENMPSLIHVCLMKQTCLVQKTRTDGLCNLT